MLVKEPLQSLQQEMMSRMTGVYEFARSTARDDSTMDSRMSVVHKTARIYFRYVIPNWPPRFLIRKLVRQLFLPMMLPQVEFNEAVRDVLQEMRLGQMRQVTVQGETLSTIVDLEQQVRTLTGQVAALRLALSTQTGQENGNGSAMP